MADITQAPVELWRYVVNGALVGYSDEAPPDDAYDEGTLTRYVASQPAQAGAEEEAPVVDVAKANDYDRIAHLARLRRYALEEISGSKSLTATPAQEARHYQRIAQKCLDEAGAQAAHIAVTQAQPAPVAVDERTLSEAVEELRTIHSQSDWAKMSDPIAVAAQIRSGQDGGDAGGEPAEILALLGRIRGALGHPDNVVMVDRVVALLATPQPAAVPASQNVGAALSEFLKVQFPDLNALDRARIGQAIMRLLVVGNSDPMPDIKRAIFGMPDADLKSRDLLVHNIGAALAANKEQQP